MQSNSHALLISTESRAEFAGNVQDANSCTFSRTVTGAAFDPIQVEVWRHLLASIAEEMGATLERTAYSPNIKERLDHSCALFDAKGRLLAQAAHIPVHLGAMPLMIQSLLQSPVVHWQPGTMWLCNDPRIGGTHLPDITLIAPIYAAPNNEALLGFVASRAHHADVGGISPGSLPLSREAFQEGLIIPPIRLVVDGTIREEILNLVCANSRTPHERRGDLSAQVAANETGIRRFRSLIATHGVEIFAKRTDENIEYAACAVREALRQLPPGTYQAEDVLDDDGTGLQDIRICVTLTVVLNGEVRFDFTGSAAQVPGSLNATEAITRSACYYIVRCLVQEDIPTNEGCFLPVTVIAPEGSVVNARFPAAVAAGNVETSQRIVDVLLRVLAIAIPDRIPAASQGTMNNLTVGGIDRVRQRPFAYYETIAGGAGGSPTGAGASGIHTHMTNTRNTPIEALETHYPLRMLEYSLATGTGGAGKHAGGEGIVRSIELLDDCHVALLTERRVHPPFGLQNGHNGTLGTNTLDSTQQEILLSNDGVPPVSPSNAHRRTLGGKWSGFCSRGTILTIQTPGGGGWGG